MHNLHLLLINAPTATDAADKADALIDGWGNDNNYYSIGAVASEDGTDDIDDCDGEYPLSCVDDCDGNTYFAKALNSIREEIQYSDFLNPDLRVSLKDMSERGSPGRS